MRLGTLGRVPGFGHAWPRKRASNSGPVITTLGDQGHGWLVGGTWGGLGQDLPGAALENASYPLVLITIFQRLPLRTVLVCPIASTILDLCR
jgi:hypothetical protein